LQLQVSDNTMHYSGMVQFTRIIHHTPECSLLQIGLPLLYKTLKIWVALVTFMQVRYFITKRCFIKNNYYFLNNKYKTGFLQVRTTIQYAFIAESPKRIGTKWIVAGKNLQNGAVWYISSSKYKVGVVGWLTILLRTVGVMNSDNMLCGCFGLFPSYVAGILNSVKQLNFYVLCNKRRLRCASYLEKCVAGK